MTFRAADVLFLLPGPTRSLRTLGAAFDALERAASSAGIVVNPEGAPADVIICQRGDATRALSEGTPIVVVWGHVTKRTARRFHYSARRIHAWGPREAVRMFVPVDERHVGRHRVRRLSGTTMRARLRKLALRASVEVGLSLPSASVTICAHDPGAPALLKTDLMLCIEDGPPRFHLDCGDGDDLQRLLFHVYDDRGPRLVVKFSRVPDNATPFQRDEWALRIVESCSTTVTRHAPRFLGRGTLGRTHFSAESYAPGVPLSNWLEQRPVPGWLPACIGAIAEWIEALEVDTASTETPGAEFSDFLPLDIVTKELRDRLEAAFARAPTVFAHGDVGTWNILADDDQFTVVDWEGAAEHAPPLWDLWYFLADAIGRSEVPHDITARIAFTQDLFAGRHARSIDVFAATDRVRTRLQMHPDDVGPLLAGCWLYHRARREARRRTAMALGDTPAPLDHLSQLALVWFDDDDLSVDWPAFRRFTRATPAGGPPF